MKQVTRSFAIVGVNCLLLGVGVVILELVFGAWLSSNDFSRLNRLNLVKDRTLNFDVSALYQRADPLITYSRDEYGLRGTHAQASEIDILTVGGSTTDQRYVGDGETWQDRLQQMFANSDRSLVISNAGVDGQSTYGHIKNFDWWFPHIPGLAPKYILFYVGLNDLYVNPGYKYDRLRRSNRSPRQIVSEKSAIWHLARTIKGAFMAMVVLRLGHEPIDFTAIRWTRKGLQNEYDFMEPRLDAYRDRLRVLATRARDLGAEPIFVSQPSRKYRISGDEIHGAADAVTWDGRETNGVDFYYMLQRINGVTRDVAMETGAHFVDLASHTDWIDTDFYDFAHMTPQGTAKVALLLFEQLVRILPPAMPAPIHEPQ